MLNRTLTILTILTALGLAAPGFARPPQARGMGGMGAERPVTLAQAAGEEKGKAKGEEHGRSEHQDEHRGRNKHHKHHGEEQHQKP